MPSRRHALALLWSIAVTDCATFDGRSAARLDGVWLVNDRDEPQRVRVAVTDGGSTVFETTRRLGTFDDPTPNDGNVTVEPPLDTGGQYVVTATVGTEEASVDTTSVVDGSERCVLVRFTLTPGSGIQPWTRSDRRCDDG